MALSKSRATVAVSNMSVRLGWTGWARTFVHAENGGEGLFCVVEGTVAVIEDADAVPELGILLRRWRISG